MSLSMKTMKPCNTYHGILDERLLHRCADGRSAFKVYFIDVVGRPEPARTVWAQSGMARDKILARLDGLEGMEGIGFITAFPHVTKIFRFGPESETVVNVRAWNPRDWTPLPLARCEEYVEFACYAEAGIALDEFNFWSAAETVEEYLARWSDQSDWPIKRHGKLMEYWQRQAGV